MIQAPQMSTKPKPRQELRQIQAGHPPARAWGDENFEFFLRISGLSSFGFTDK
jgi:hypothetical protein